MREAVIENPVITTAFVAAYAMGVVQLETGTRLELGTDEHCRLASDQGVP